MPAYPKEHLHRIKFTALTTAQIGQKLAPAIAAGPAAASPLSEEFVGESVTIVTDGGPKLAYKFGSKNKLSVSVNGAAAVEAGYGALTLGEGVCFFSHLVPGTQTGYHVVIDRRSKLATVVETWFSGEVFNGTGDRRTKLDINREVQREVYFGALDGAESADRHFRTNRVEGKGFYWKQEAANGVGGLESLEFYPSAAFSHFVELSRTGGELGFCAPSDYVRIDEDNYIYTRTECELGGMFTLYVMNVNTVEQAGVRLGFDEKDALTYYVFKGAGEWVGQIAQFEKFGDTKEGTVMPAPQDGSPLPKGARRVYRPMLTYEVLTKEEVAAAAAKPSVFPEATTSGGAAGMSGNKTPPTDYLVGKTFTLKWDNGSTLEYKVADLHTLSWRRPGETAWHDERYEAWESAPGLIMWGHLLTGAPDHDCQIIVADFHHGLATLLHGTVGNAYIPNEAAVKVVFGVVEAEGLVPPMYRRHQFTDELVGRAITWNYSQQTGLTSMHLYSTPNTLSWIIFANNAGGMEWSGPSAHVKIREGIYLSHWIEEACNGTLGTLLINMRTMHDCGVGFHCGRNGLSLSSVGAHARHAGKFDVAKYYQIKA